MLFEKIVCGGSVPYLDGVIAVESLAAGRCVRSNGRYPISGTVVFVQILKPNEMNQRWNGFGVVRRWREDSRVVESIRQ
jgi:hypothetical protein